MLSKARVRTKRNRLLGSILAFLVLISTLTAAPVHADSPTWQDLLNQAEPLYSTGKLKQALPLYEQAQKLAQSTNISRAGQIQCLQYLGDCLCRLNQPELALANYQQVEKLLDETDSDAKIENLDQQAFCLAMHRDYGKADETCNEALRLANSTKQQPVWEIARTTALLGYIDYVRADYTDALKHFEAAQQLVEQTQRSDLNALVLKRKIAFAQAGSYYHLRRFGDAYRAFKRMYDIDVRLFGNADLQTGWSMQALSDVCQKTGRTTESADWYEKAVYVFRRVNLDRLCEENHYGADSAECKRMTQLVFGTAHITAQSETKPLCSDASKLIYNHDPCSLCAQFFVDAPGRVWLDPNAKQHGIIIAVHGLSLEHSSYDAFAQEAAKHGWSTVAFDVRGFGSYRQALGAERLDFEGCQQDLRALAGALRHDFPGVPLFILGESMGGAIALQFAAQNPQLVDGVIASVPAGKRFKQRRTAIKVAMHYIQDKNRPFDIGSDVINQATDDPKLKESWSTDPKTRGTLTAKELLAFQLMCDRNLDAAKQIRTLPVIVFQGVGDALIKPDATYDLFRAIQSKDKSLVMVGNAEHLIFEEACFTPPVINGLFTWLDTHSGR